LPNPRSVAMTRKKPAFSRASSMAGLFSPTRSKRIHKGVLDCRRIESISDPMCEFMRSCGRAGPQAPAEEGSRLMALVLRPTGLASPASKEHVDFIIYDDGEAVGRIYKIGGIDTAPDVRWSWSITAYVDPMLGIATSAKVATLEEAKAQFRQNWRRANAHSRAAHGRGSDADKAHGADTD
jgi:hypothetical protein